MAKIKLNIKELKKFKDILEMLNEKNFEALRHSGISIDEKGVSTNAGTKDDSAIKYRDSLVISAMILNILLLIIDKWDSLDKDCREFIESNLELIRNYTEER